MKALQIITGLLVLALLPWSATVAAEEEEAEFTDEFPLERCQFLPWGGNPFFKLNPGRQLYYTNKQCLDTGECAELEELWITVNPQTRTIPLQIEGKRRWVTTRVIEKMETADGELVEISRNYFSNCTPNRDVYYFGEEVDIYEDGEIVSHDGAWLAGKHGAQPGLIMPEDAFLLGSRYFQEVAPGVALDRAEHVAAGMDIEVPAGSFEDCVEITETTPLEPGSESTKVYCPGVGMVIDNELELAAIFGDSDDEDED